MRLILKSIYGNKAQSQGGITFNDKFMRVVIGFKHLVEK